MIATLDARLCAPGPKRILALDGAQGARGLIPVAALSGLHARLAAMSPDPSAFRLSDYFDLCVGAGPGAAAAALIAQGASGDEAARVTADLAPRDLAHPGAVARAVGAAALRDAPWRSGWGVWRPRRHDADPDLVITAPRTPIWTDRYADLQLADVIAHSAAAPLACPAFEAVRAMRAPAYASEWRAGRRDLLVVSVGVGWRAPSERDAAAHDALSATVSVLEALGTSLRSWRGNGSSQGRIPPEPAFSLLRLDVRLETSPVEALGVTASDRDLARLTSTRETGAKARRLAQALGTALGASVSDAEMPAMFTPSGFPARA